jgi:hypothetical protein
LRHLESYLGDLASSFEETDGPERERSDELVASARRRASELEQLAMSFEDEVETEASKWPSRRRPVSQPGGNQ